MHERSADSPAPADEASITRLRGYDLLAGLSGRWPDALPRSEVSFLLARELASAAKKRDRDVIPEAARLHEVGKVYLPASLLSRPVAGLSEEERGRLDEYFAHGRRLALGAGVPPRACSWILHARERWDGGGPGGLHGEDIPFGARVIAVCREYLDTPLPADESGPQALRDAAAEHLRAVAGERLDPALAARAAELSGGRAGRR